jgi:DNA-binding Lrp family transcriptional regulator
MVTISESLNISSRTVDNYIREYLDEKQIETITFGVFKKQKGAA